MKSWQGMKDNKFSNLILFIHLTSFSVQPLARVEVWILSFHFCAPWFDSSLSPNWEIFFFIVIALAVFTREGYFQTAATAHLHLQRKTLFYMSSSGTAKSHQSTCYWGAQGGSPVTVAACEPLSWMPSSTSCRRLPGTLLVLCGTSLCYSRECSFQSLKAKPLVGVDHGRIMGASTPTDSPVDVLCFGNPTIK